MSRKVRFLVIILIYLRSIKWINANSDNINDDSGKFVVTFFNYFF